MLERKTATRLRIVSARDIESPKLAEGIIAQKALTNSKRPASFVEGVYPTHVLSGSGCMLTDTAGNQYIDFICGLGANLLGYGNSPVVEAGIKALREGPTLSLSTDLEIKLGKKINEVMPFVERIKVLKSGSEGCTAAVRIARAFNKRQVLLTHGYHGWHDEFVSMQPPAFGVTHHANIGKLVNLDQITNETAAVILEPVITELNDVRIEWLRDLRDKCTKTGTVLIFDETITALRFPNFCVANYLSIAPDIIIFGKALGNGMPISIVAGKKEVMECCEYFVSSTFAGERVSIASSIEVLTQLQKNYDLNSLWEKGKYFCQKFNELFKDVKIDGYPTRGVLKGEPFDKAIFMQEACKAGLLFGASWFFNFNHIEKMDLTFSTLKEIALKMNIGNITLEGNMPKSPFAQQVREKA
jgi:glutamate-1-semialdehyde 2,1-aminomutase